MKNDSKKKKVLITGGCGKIGSYFARYAADKYDLRIVDKELWDAKELGPLKGESLIADLEDLKDCRKACEGMDMVVHLAADPSPKAEFFDSLLANNILATHNIFRAAKEEGCKRVIFASSIHVFAAYPADVQCKVDTPVQPGDLYGVTKCFGEALASYFANCEGLPSIAMRIGAYLYPDEIENVASEEVNAYLNPDDFNQLLEQCLEKPDITFAIVHAISDNRYKRLDLTETRKLMGYHPQADGFDLVGLIPKDKPII